MARLRAARPRRPRSAAGPPRTTTSPPRGHRGTGWRSPLRPRVLPATAGRPGETARAGMPLVLDEYVRVLLLDDRDDRPREGRRVQHGADPFDPEGPGTVHSSSAIPTKIFSPSSRTG